MTKAFEVTVVVPWEAASKGTHGSVIRIAMAEEGIRGNEVNYAIIDGAALVTSYGRYTVKSNSLDCPVDVRNVDGDGALDPNVERTVVHRRNLWRFVGAAQAKKFWRYGRRTRK